MKKLFLIGLPAFLALAACQPDTPPANQHGGSECRDQSNPSGPQKGPVCY